MVGTARNKLVTISAVFPKKRNGFILNTTAFHKSKTEQISYPFRNFEIIFVTFNVIYPFRIGNGNIDIILQKIENRNLIFFSGFHADIMKVIFKKP